MRKRITKPLLPIILLILLTTFNACTAAGLQVNERAFVQLFAMEKKNGNFSVTLQLPEAETVSGTGTSILAAVADAERKQGKKLFLGQMKLFVIGNGLTDLSRDLNVFLSGDICPACPVIFSENPADIAESGTEAEEILESLNVYASQGLSVITPLTALAAAAGNSDEDGTSSTVVPVAVNNETIEFDGLALIGAGDSVSFLPADDILGLKLLCGGTEPSDKITVTTITDGHMISGEILGAKTKWDLQADDGIIIAQITLRIKADITEKPIEMSDQTALKAIEKYTAEALAKTYEILARDQMIDAFGFGKRVRKELPNTYKKYVQNPTVYLSESVLEVKTER